SRRRSLPPGWPSTSSGRQWRASTTPTATATWSAPARHSRATGSRARRRSSVAESSERRLGGRLSGSVSSAVRAARGQLRTAAAAPPPAPPPAAPASTTTAATGCGRRGGVDRRAGGDPRHPLLIEEVVGGGKGRVRVVGRGLVERLHEQERVGRRGHVDVRGQ